jgi:aspartate racemase
LKAAGLEQGIPTPRQRERIDQISFDELVQARFSSPSRTHVQEEIGNLADQACDVVVLGCKQIPLRVMPESSALPIPDSTRCRASAVVSKAVGHA